MSDKYDEKAASMAAFICACRGNDSTTDCPRIEAVARALCESAAEAMYEANAVYQLAASGTKDWDPMEEVARRAASLRRPA